MSNTVILIPSRLAATRLPNKPLLKINNISIINHVYKIAKSSLIGESYVATGDKEIFEEVTKLGGKCILTKKDHKTGTDRIHEALEKLNDKSVDLVMNLQGDEPLMNVEDIRNLKDQMIKNSSQLGTLASKIPDKILFDNQNVVKVETKKNLDKDNFPEAINFMRKISEKKENIYHHLGIYCYRKEVLKKFVSFKQSANEIKNNLEQLRALDNKVRINVALAKSSPIGVDTEEDFVAIKKIMEYNL